MKKIFTLISAVMLCLGASAQTQKLADVIKATMDTCQHEIVPVFLTKYVTYELDSQVELGKKGVILWGGEATIIVKGEGQIATQGYLQVRNAKFDCAEATKAPIALSATPDESLRGSEAMFEGANTDVFYNNHKVSVVKCIFREVKTPLFYANKASWALNTLELDRNIVQLNITNDNPVISTVGSSRGAIKHIILTNNVIYNIDAANEKSYGIVRYGNGSNAQPQKVWGAAGTSDFVMKNNTIALPGKAFANNFPNKNNVTLDWKQNVFINTPYLQKIGQNNLRTFTAEDNTLFVNNGKTLDATDLSKFGTEDKAAGLDVPEGALEFANTAILEEFFKPNFVSQTTYKQNGAYTLPFKSTIYKHSGSDFELILGPDLLAQYPLVDNCAEADLGKMKPGINTDLYPWIQYIRSDNKNILSNGQNEAQQSNKWTDLNPETGEQGTFIQVKGINGSVYSPVLGKNNNKCIKLYVKDIAAIQVFATGSASGSAADGNAIVLNVQGTDGSKGTASTLPGSIFGKGTASACVEMVLTPDAAHEVTIESVNKDIQILGIRLYSDDQSKFPVCHAPETKAPGTNYEVLNLSNALTKKTKEGAEKYAIDDAKYPWVNYNYQASILDDGTCEVSRGGIYSSIDPVTEAQLETPVYITDDNDPCQWLGSPKVEIGYTKTEDGLALNLYPKTLTFGVQKTTRAALILTGGGSNTNVADVVVKDNAGNTVKTIHSDEMPGKSNKANLTATQSKIVEIADLDPYKSYTITVEPCMDVAQINGTSIKGPAVYVVALHLTGTDLSIAPAEDNPGMGDATGIENVENNIDANAPAYNVAGQRVNGTAKGLIIKGGKKFINR